jgi:hypothetical protein
MRIALALLLLTALARADASVPAPPPLDDAGRLSLTRAVLRYGIVERRAPDLPLVARQPQLLIGDDFTMPIESALRGLPIARPIRVLDAIELRRLTERRQRDVFFISLQLVESNHDRAVVSLGTRLIFPNRDHDVHLCCCEENVRFERRGRRWLFAEVLGSICS